MLQAQISDPTFPSPDLPPLRVLLRRLYATCPSVERRLGGAFVELWQEHIGAIYCVDETRLLNLLVLNQEVQGIATGGEGEPYGRLAAGNVIRLRARLGATSPNGVDPESADIGRDEFGWLSWCEWWNGARKGPPPLHDWSPASNRWAAVRLGVSVLEEGATHEDLAAWAMESGADDSATPMPYVKRLIRLALATSLFHVGDFAGTRRYAALCDRDGDWLVAASRLAEEHGADLRHLISFRVYQCRRLADRLERLGYPCAAERQRASMAAWLSLSNRSRSEETQ